LRAEQGQAANVIRLAELGKRGLVDIQGGMHTALPGVSKLDFRIRRDSETPTTSRSASE
jgi:hypothetical protein